MQATKETRQKESGMKLKLPSEREEFSTNPSKYDGLNNTCRDGFNEYRRNTGKSKTRFNWKCRLNQQYRRCNCGYTKREVCML